MRVLNSVDPELEEDDGILNNSSQRSNKPRKIGEEILFLCRMAKNLYEPLAYVQFIVQRVVSLTPAP